jgi:hypothetical protein
MPLWVYVFVAFLAAILLVPVVFTAWLERTRGERRRRTEALVARTKGDADPETPLP